MGKRDRKRRPARRPPFKDSKPLILIVTEGRVTEPEYLNGFVKAAQNPRVQIKVVEGAGVPMTIVRKAKDEKQEAEERAKHKDDDNERYDEVWCVFDVDDHPNIPAAKQMAIANDLRLAVSNPCIELWLWLHFADQPGARRRDELRKMMKKHIADYDKHVDYDQYAAGYEDARNRVSRLDSSAAADGDEGRNPTTGIWKLTESIRSET